MHSTISMLKEIQKKWKMSKPQSLGPYHLVVKTVRNMLKTEITMPDTMWLRTKEQLRTKSWWIQREWKKRQPGKLQGKLEFDMGHKDDTDLNIGGAKQRSALGEDSGAKARVKVEPGFLGWYTEPCASSWDGRHVVNLRWSATGSSSMPLCCPNLAPAWWASREVVRGANSVPNPTHWVRISFSQDPRWCILESEKYWCKFPVIK